MSDLMKPSSGNGASGSSGGRPLEAFWKADRLPPEASVGERSVSLSASPPARGGSLPSRAPRKGSPPSQAQRLPNASVVYGVGASVLFVLAFAILFNGLWLTSLLVMLPALCFLGFAVHYIRMDSPD